MSGFLLIFFFFSCISLTALIASFERLGKLQTEEALKKERSPFFFRRFSGFLFGNYKWEGLFFALNLTNHLARLGLVLSFLSFSPSIQLISNLKSSQSLVLTISILIFLFLLIDFLTHLLGKNQPQLTFRLFSFSSSCLLFLSIPLIFPFFQLIKLFLSTKKKQEPLLPNFKIRDKVEELLQETELGKYLDATEQKFILSIVSFKERIAREVMVPRINLFTLAVETSIEEAAENFLKERYSRIPVYKDSVDNIIGVLLYKDILNIYINSKKGQQQLDQSIEKWVKPVLYTPETKKISHLLQEFRNKQIHLAIVVDEWGGTEGIVTIEDILEELVGEIADEYDVGQQSLFIVLPGGGWLIDAKMSILDIQDELDVKIPLSPEYDTIGGYVFHKAGEIPSKGWRIHHDEFDLEVISSNERAIKKIKIVPI